MSEFIAQFTDPGMWRLVLTSTWQTLIMVFFSSIFSFIIGLPLGVVLHVTDQEIYGGLKPMPLLNSVLSRIVNIFRSFPFIILIIILMPLSRIIVGTGIGTVATIVPLSIAAAPFVARVIESSLKEIDPGVVQAARAMGSTNDSYDHKPHRVFSDGRCPRRGWPGRPCDPLRLPAVQACIYGCCGNNHIADGGDHTVRRKQDSKSSDIKTLI